MNRSPEDKVFVRRSWAPTTLAQSVLLLLLANLGAKVFGFLRSVFTCRLLPEEELGRWDLVYGFILLAAPAVMLGIPGSLGRYLEHFAKRQVLCRMLQHILIILGVLTLLGTVGLILGAEPVAWLLLRLPQQRPLVLWTAGALALAMWFFIFQEIFGGLRRFQLVATLQALQTVLFMVLSLGLLLWHPGAESVLAGFAFSCAVGVLLGAWWLWRLWPQLNQEELPQPLSPLWRKMMQFALWVWITNWLTNLFQVLDRYMLVHLSGLKPQAVLAQVGNYHAAWILPLVVVSLGGTVNSALVPHLSRDWEQGHRARVQRTLLRTIRLGAVVLTLTVAAIVGGAWLLYDVVLEHKYSLALPILPWIAALAAWSVLAMLVGCYLWCAERAGWETGAVALALVSNALLNALLIPRWQLHGAVVATTTSHLVLLVVLGLMAQRLGLPMSWRSWVLLLTPGSVLLGPVALGLVGAWLVADLLWLRLLFPWHDRCYLEAYLGRLWRRVGKLASSDSPASSPKVKSWEPSSY